MPFFKPEFSNCFSDIANEKPKTIQVIYRLGLKFCLVPFRNTTIIHPPPVNEIYQLYNSRTYQVHGCTISRLMNESIDHSFFFMQPGRLCPMCISP
jgi:hypothetical protein